MKNNNNEKNKNESEEEEENNSLDDLSMTSEDFEVNKKPLLKKNKTSEIK